MKQNIESVGTRQRGGAVAEERKSNSLQWKNRENNTKAVSEQ